MYIGTGQDFKITYFEDCMLHIDTLEILNLRVMTPFWVKHSFHWGLIWPSENLDSYIAICNSSKIKQNKIKYHLQQLHFFFS